MLEPSLFAFAAVPFAAKILVLVTGQTGYAVQSFYKIFQIIIPVFWRRQKDGKRGIRMFWPFDEPLPSRSVWFSATALALIMSGIGIALLKYLIPFFDLDPVSIRSGFDSRFDVSPIGAVSVVIFLSIINSAVEELHFRAWLDREVSRIAGNLTGISTSAIAFGSMHALIFIGLPSFPPLLVAIAGIALAAAGASWSLIMRKNGGIHAAWWSHALTDAVLLTWGLNWLGYV